LRELGKVLKIYDQEAFTVVTGGLNIFL
jgi:hypothetical protein